MGVTRTYTLKGDRDKVYSRVVKKMESESSLVKAGAVSDGLDCTPSVGYRKMRIIRAQKKASRRNLTSATEKQDLKKFPITRHRFR